MKLLKCIKLEYLKTFPVDALDTVIFIFTFQVDGFTSRMIVMFPCVLKVFRSDILCLDGEYCYALQQVYWLTLIVCTD